MMNSHKPIVQLTRAVCIAISAWSMSALSTAGVQLDFTTEYGMEFVTIGDPGNRPTRPEEGNPIFADQHLPRGAVDYEYRIARTEVTIGQYFEFVDAYFPLDFKRTGRVLGNSDFTGLGIATNLGGAFIRPGISPNSAANMSWEYAARYVNWLHNDKVNQAWAFDAGVYDTSTFTENPDGTFNHQATHASDARLWIPTQDEWIKAGYWDPNKDDGKGGYWLFPNSSDTESIPGLLPEEGGERNAGPSGGIFPLDVGSFTDIQSPWGLFDLAGGESEWSETISSKMRPQRRLIHGTRWTNATFGDPIFPNDIVGSGRSGGVRTIWGLRLAAAVPSIGTIPIMMVGFSYFTRRKR